ncbi:MULTISPECIES: GDCCVxC domain-containing (seleno)protein [unclassified Dyella]|uniref:GDCCVxC domain-containing (seleno)protein n=1 Tax=unclassified Dyella TaxID=2634549 RepID=UPI003F8F44AF
MDSKRTLILQSTVTCPLCGHRSQETMPTNYCWFFYDCPGCGEVVRPKAGDCCVFCSYGTAPCPPKQQEGSCCH